MPDNLGWVKAVHEGSIPPSNTKMLWYDTSVSKMKYYNDSTSSWQLMVNVMFYASSLPEVLTSGVLYIVMSTNSGYVSDENGVRKVFGIDTVREIAGVLDTISEDMQTTVDVDMQYIVKHRMKVRGHMIVKGALIVN